MTSNSSESEPVVVVAFDGSESSTRACYYAIGMADRIWAQVLVIHVRPLDGLTSIDPRAVPLIEDAYDKVFIEVQEILSQGQPVTLRSVEFMERSGEPYREIVAVARDRRPQAVIVGFSMRMKGRRTGSLVSRLCRAAEWPVIVVP